MLVMMVFLVGSSSFSAGTTRPGPSATPAGQELAHPQDESIRPYTLKHVDSVEVMGADVPIRPASLGGRIYALEAPTPEQDFWDEHGDEVAGGSILIVVLLAIIVLLAYLNVRRLRAERALRKLTTELEQTVQQRTAELVYSEKQYRSLFENANDGTLIVDLEGNMLVVNDRWCERLDYPAAEMRGMNIRQMLTESEAQRVGHLTTTVQKNGSLVVESAEVARNGQVIPVEVSARMIEHHGQPAILVSSRDIRERKAAERQLQEREELFRQMAENIHELFYVRDPATNNTLYVSPIFERLWGAERKKVFSSPQGFIETIHPDDRQRVKEEMKRRREDRSLVDMEYRIVRSDGAVRWIWDRLFPILNEHGEVYRLAGIAADITERKQSEADRLELALERERTDILTRFIHDASTEFYTPLSTIIMNLYLLRRSVEGEDGQQLVSRIEKQANDLSELVEELISMSELDSDVPFSMETLDVGAVLSLVLHRNEQAIKEAGLELLYQEKKLPVIWGSTARLYEAFHQILDNALRYTPEGGEIEVGAQVDEGYVMVIFRDTGHGIEETHLPYIFDRFYRVDEAHSTRGFGLGLSIARKIIDRHRGRIEVESRPGKGTTLHIWLPRLPVTTN
jgi:PAS domain S-box-containing protein